MNNEKEGQQLTKAKTKWRLTAPKVLQPLPLDLQPDNFCINMSDKRRSEL
jgi:hypothetical protein